MSKGLELDRKLLLVVLITLAVVVIAIGAYSWIRPEIGWRLEIVVDGETVKTYGLSDLRDLEATSITVEDHNELVNMTGVRLYSVLYEAGVKASLIESMDTIAADGYSRTLERLHIDNDLILAFLPDEEGGPVRLVDPDLGHKYWVKSVAKIELATASEYSVLIVIDGQPYRTYAISQLARFDPVNLTIENKEYTGVRLLDVLSDCSVGNIPVDVWGADAYHRPVEQIDEDTILALTESGIRLVDPGTEDGSWVKHVVEISAP